MSEPATQANDKIAQKVDQSRKEPLEKLDAEFLDYLATFENDEDDWTLFEDESVAKQVEPVTEPASAPKESDKP